MSEVLDRVQSHGKWDEYMNRLVANMRPVTKEEGQVVANRLKIGSLNTESRRGNE